MKLIFKKSANKTHQASFNKNLVSSLSKFLNLLFADEISPDHIKQND